MDYASERQNNTDESYCDQEPDTDFNYYGKTPISQNLYKQPQLDGYMRKIRAYGDLNSSDMEDESN